MATGVFFTVYRPTSLDAAAATCSSTLRRRTSRWAAARCLEKSSTAPGLEIFVQGRRLDVVGAGSKSPTTTTATTPSASNVTGASKKQQRGTEKRQQGHRGEESAGGGAGKKRRRGAATSREKAGPGCGQQTVGAVQTPPTSSTWRARSSHCAAPPDTSSVLPDGDSSAHELDLADV
jgi:hypothetical protein